MGRDALPQQAERRVPLYDLAVVYAVEGLQGGLEGGQGLVEGRPGVLLLGRNLFLSCARPASSEAQSEGLYLQGW